MPILIVSAARALMMKGDATCASPAAAAALMTVRRSGRTAAMSMRFIESSRVFLCLAQGVA